MGQLAYFVVVFHILLDASTELPVMSLSKIELRQLVRKTSHNITLSKIPPSHSLAPFWKTALTPTPVSAHLFLSAIWLKSTHTIKQKKYLLLWAWFPSTESPIWNRLSSSCVVIPPGLGIYSRITALGQRGFYSFLRVTISSHQEWLIKKKPSDQLYLLCFNVKLPFKGFKIRLVAVTAFPVAR